MGRGALALRIALLQADLARAPVVTLPSPPPPPEPEPVITELPAPPEPPPAPKPVKAKKKVSFGAISLDDAASLLSAFGGAPAATDDSPPPGRADAKLLTEICRHTANFGQNMLKRWPMPDLSLGLAIIR
jgi:hypothetical protein